MELSRRHHYIPQFLIKKFCGSDNKVWIYDKDSKQIISKKKSPKFIFFEWERNLFDLNEKVSDNIEKMYADVDTMLSETLDKILRTHTMSGREQTLMIFLVALMKWRIPKSDDSFHELVKDIPITDLGMNFRPIDLNEQMDEETAKRINDLEIVRETKRLLLPIQPLLRDEVLKEIHKDCFIVVDDQYPSLLGDCPIIEAENSDYKTLENFIFPLSKSETFIFKKNAYKSIMSHLFYIQRDLAIFHLSEKYVACSDKKHLENIVESYRNLERENKTHLILKYVFEFIK